MSLTPLLAAAVDAVYAGRPDMVPEAFDQATARLPDVHPYHGIPWLCFVIRCATDNELDFVQAALDAGADPNLPHMAVGGRMYPLHLAVKHGHADIVKELLSRGANRHAVTNTNRTADDILTYIEDLELPDTVADIRAALNSN